MTTPNVLEEKDPSESTSGAALTTAAENALTSPPPLSTFPSVKSKKKKSKKKKWIILGICFILLLALAFFIYQSLKPQPVETPVAFVYRGMLENEVSGNATASPTDRKDLLTSAKGEVLEVFVSEGDRVNEGDLLFLIDRAAYEEEVSEAQQRLTRAAEELDNANRRVANLNITAPIYGKTIEITVKNGDYVGENTKIGYMFDDSRMKLKLYFNYSYIDVLAVGQECEVSIPQSMSTVYGTIASVENIKRISPDGTVLFMAEITLDNPGTLARDMLATATIKTANGDVMPAESGKLEYHEETDLIAKTSGTVEEIYMKDYYEFNRGALLCRLSNDTVGTGIAAAQRDYNTALEAMETLGKKEKEYEGRAPISGTVLGISIFLGDELDGNSKVAMSVADLSSMKIAIQVDELDINKLKVGMPAEIILEYDGGGMFFGEITSLSMEGKAENGVSFFPGEITVTDVEGTGIMTGMYVKYRIVTTQKNDVLIIPSSAAIYTEMGLVAFVREGTAPPDQILRDLPPDIVPEGFDAVMIETGEGANQLIEVVSGLEDGWEIATNNIPEPDYGGGMIFY